MCVLGHSCISNIRVPVFGRVSSGCTRFWSLLVQKLAYMVYTTPILRLLLLRRNKQKRLKNRRIKKMILQTNTTTIIDLPGPIYPLGSVVDPHLHLDFGAAAPPPPAADAGS